MVRRSCQEESEAGPKLHGIHAAEDVDGATVAEIAKQVAALDESRSQQGMCDVRLGLLQVSQSVQFGRRAATERRELRKDEPHPMARLAPGAQLGQDFIPNRGLRIDESVQGDIGVDHAFTLSRNCRQLATFACSDVVLGDVSTGTPRTLRM